MTTTVYFTTDGGKTWTGRSTPTTGSLSAFSFADPLHGWYETKENSVLMRTVDGGKHWEALSHDAVLTNTQWLQFVTPTTGFAISLEAEELLKTADGGTTWQRIPVRVGIP
jgi:photosystem II stability/assembly factor-like uncharacterized protein